MIDGPAFEDAPNPLPLGGDRVASEYWAALDGEV